MDDGQIGHKAMKSQDIVVLLKLALLHKRFKGERDIASPNREEFRVRDLGASLFISKSEVDYSIKRSIQAGLALKDRVNGIPKANVSAVLEFAIHGLKYVFPPLLGAMVRGMPTASAAPVLKNKLQSSGDTICVWPDPEGKAMGQEIKPLFKSVPEAARSDAELYDVLALVDAILIGNPRESKVAQELLEQKLKA